MENEPEDLIQYVVQIILTPLWISVSSRSRSKSFTKCLGAHMPVGVEGILLDNFDLVTDKMQQILITEVEPSQLSENLLVKRLLRINVCV